jgi:hypothetical protein
VVNLNKGTKNEQPRRRGVSLAKPVRAGEADPPVPAGRPLVEQATSELPAMAWPTVGTGNADSRQPWATRPTAAYQPTPTVPPSIGQPAGLPPVADASTGSKRGLRWFLMVAAGLTALVLICVLAVVEIGGQPAARKVAPPTLGFQADSSQPSSEVSSESTVVSPSRSVRPPPAVPRVTPAGINIAAIQRDPHISKIADLFDRYLIATNAHDSSGLSAIFDPAGVTRSDTPAGIAEWEAEVATTYDDQMILDAVRPYPQVPGGLLVHARFRSQQDPSLGPDGQSCTNWNLVYRLTPYGSGYRVIGAQQVQAVAC